MINKFDHKYIKINYKNILDAYCNGIFPMAENIDSSDVFWVKPKNRGVINPYKINIRRKLKRFINTEPLK
jgi:leucyl/phenylalanyl-tRNA--protein transferase